MEKKAAILITGSTGMVGAATIKQLRNEGFTNLLTPSHKELDLTDEKAVDSYFECYQPEYVLMIAAKVGGIVANSSDPVGFLDENMRITLNLFSACHKFKTRKNLFLGSSCIYPRKANQPIKEEYLLTGPLEPTNEGYALAKITGLKLAQYYFHQYGLTTVCPMPCNIYGTGDSFDLKNSHVLSALVRRFVDAKDDKLETVTLWGTGIAKREFIHVDDVVRAILFCMEYVNSAEHLNIGPGIDINIHDLAELVALKTGYQGNIQWDTTMPDGMLRKCLDVSRMRQMGFQPIVNLNEGVERTIEEYLSQKEKWNY